jgi:GDPmannose 4,6-dehydratase
LGQNRRRALVTGINGQDGSYLAQLLLLKGYDVYGLTRSRRNRTLQQIELFATSNNGVPGGLHLIDGDLRDLNTVMKTIEDVAPTEIYNLASQSNVARSFSEPELTHEVNYLAVSQLIDAIRASGIDTRFFQASSSEMFGLTKPPQNEVSPFMPQSPYAVAKTGAHVQVNEMREALGLFAVSGIAFNHESPRRPEAFVTRKISSAVASIARGQAETLHLGNIEAVRDWGYAPEYVEGMWRSLQHDEPNDYVFASGQSHTVRDFAQFAFAAAGLDWRDHVVHDDKLERAHDMKASVGDASRARQVLGWSATVTTQELAGIMVDYDLSGNDKVDVPRLDSWS